MSKCNRCGVNIVDNTDSCPLCHHVLVREAEEKDNMYPSLTWVRLSEIDLAWVESDEEK